MGKKIKVILQPIKFKKQDHVAIICNNESAVDEIVREIDEMEWSTGFKFWHMPLNKNTVKTLSNALRPIATVNTIAFKNYQYTAPPEKPKRHKKIKVQPPNEEMTYKIEKFYQTLANFGFNESSAKVYRSMLRIFFGWHNQKTDNDITDNDIRNFIKDYFEANNYTVSYKKLILNAVRLYYKEQGKSYIDL